MKTRSKQELPPRMIERVTSIVGGIVALLAAIGIVPESYPASEAIELVLLGLGVLLAVGGDTGLSAFVRKFND